jgi:hypothetical protein
LTAACAPAVGATNGVATSAIVRLASSPQYDTGQEYLLKNGCGDIVAYSREQNRLKEVAITLELATKDFELIELLTGGSLIVDSTGNNIGIARRGVGKVESAYVSLEIWTTTIDANGPCQDATTDPGYYRVIFPRATFTLGDSTFENGVAMVTLTGFGTNNPQWGNGPWNDYPGTTVLDPKTPEAIVLDATGPPTLTNGYIAVPTQT